jgi:hypothetical protein
MAGVDHSVVGLSSPWPAVGSAYLGASTAPQCLTTCSSHPAIFLIIETSPDSFQGWLAMAGRDDVARSFIVARGRRSASKVAKFAPTTG